MAESFEEWIDRTIRGIETPNHKVKFSEFGVGRRFNLGALNTDDVRRASGEQKSAILAAMVQKHQPFSAVVAAANAMSLPVGLDD